MNRPSLRAVVVLALVALSACGGGVSKADLDEAQNDLRSAEAEARQEKNRADGLRGRLDRAAAIEDALGIMDGGTAVSAAVLIELAGAVEASGDERLRVGLENVVETVFASAGPISTAALEAHQEAVAAALASGNQRIQDLLQEFMTAALLGGGGQEMLDIAAAVDSEGDSRMKDALAGMLDRILSTHPGVPGLQLALSGLVTGSNDERVRQTFDRFMVPPQAYFNSLEAVVDEIGDESIKSRFRQDVLSPDGDPDGFRRLLVEELDKALRGQ